MISECELVRRAQSGDEAALALLFEQSTAGIKRSIDRRLAPAVQRKVSTSDVFQEALITAARRVDTFEYRGEGSFRRWLAGIAENVRRAAVSRNTQVAKRDIRAEVTRGARPETRHTAGKEATPSRVAMARETRERVAQVLEVLPEDYRTVIQLLEGRKMSLAEASELMGRSSNAVKKLHARALVELARRLDLGKGADHE